ncbi:CAP domain-containing protein [Bdellovibrio sp. SKB1291214]|uniref:CAP domain-containing protein n=1 Tax=Bdellovibrio sp. SKB1291214 TaxID=1732569 RepID=UPI000B515BE3|nr:CAP domain-containing protein [Bdellovibrio sp. SKB1291214]UYL09811.1 CAP domain-containing protein [Bdellovibrio sp. SKB1291214]
MNTKVLTLTMVAMMLSLTACNGGFEASSALGIDSAQGSNGSVTLPSAGADGCYGMDANTCLVFKATNTQRVANGLAALVYCQACTQMAFEQSKDMSDRQYFDHERPDETFSHRVARFGLTAGCAENIAQGYTPETVVTGWMVSPGHRNNILNGNYKSLGIGLYNGYATQVFYAGTNR